MTYKATAVKVHQDLGSVSLISVPLTSVKWCEAEDRPVVCPSGEGSSCQCRDAGPPWTQVSGRV